MRGQELKRKGREGNLNGKPIDHQYTPIGSKGEATGQEVKPESNEC
jgi:hypothetical protein